MNAPDIRFPIGLVEGVHLAGLVDDFVALLTAAENAPDIGIERLTPTPYPDDAQASAEFASATRDDLRDRRADDAAVVRRTLEPFLEKAAANLVDEDDFEEIDVVIPTKAIDPWLRMLTSLRLVIATRLNIADDDSTRDPEDPQFGIFDWLGYRLDGLIAVVDAQENERS